LAGLSEYEVRNDDNGAPTSIYARPAKNAYCTNAVIDIEEEDGEELCIAQRHKTSQRERKAQNDNNKKKRMEREWSCGVGVGSPKRPPLKMEKTKQKKHIKGPYN
jgi:hypothetical protein